VHTHGHTLAHTNLRRCPIVLASPVQKSD
jgi:hypothetical protein